MKRNLMILALMGVFAFVAIPAVSPVSAQERNHHRYSQTRRDDGDRHHRRNYQNANYWNRNHKKYTHGYKNYGQYRRTQVGNRRHYTRRHHNIRSGGVRNN